MKSASSWHRVPWCAVFAVLVPWACSGGGATTGLGGQDGSAADAGRDDGGSAGTGSDGGGEVPGVVSHDLEIANWWSAPGTLEAVTAIIGTYKSEFPGANVTNTALASSAAIQADVNARLGNGTAPPELFMTNNGGAGFPQYLAFGGVAGNNQLQQLDDFFVAKGWDKSLFPEVLKNVKSPDGHFYMVPTDVHRKNVLIYNKRLFKLAGVTTLPTTMSEFIETLAKLDALQPKIVPLATASDEWVNGVLWESVFMSVAGPDYYTKFQHRLIDMDVDSGPLTEAANAMVAVCKYIDHPASRAWRPTADFMMSDGAAMFVLADYAPAYLVAKGFPDGVDWGSVPFPGTENIYSYTVDGYVAFKNAKNPAAARTFLGAWLSQKGQIAFASKKYSIPPIAGLDVSGLPKLEQRNYPAFADRSVDHIGQGSDDMWCSPNIDGVISCGDHMTVSGKIVKASLMGATPDVPTIVKWYRDNYDLTAP